MLKKLSKVEQRYDAVLAVIRDGQSVKEVALALGVARLSEHRWLADLRRGGLDALVDGSHRPRASPLQMPARIEARVLELCRLHPCGARRDSATSLSVSRPSPCPPSRASTARFLDIGGSRSEPTRKRVPTYKRWERGRPMELWRMGVVGGVLLEDGTECKVLTGVDDHSHFSVCAGVMARATVRASSLPPKASSNAAG